jgi:hypothetical protein
LYSKCQIDDAATDFGALLYAKFPVDDSW